MPLLEVLMLQVAPALAKAIVKRWLKEENFAADVSSTLIDFLKVKTGDVIAQQRGKRQFEEIGERVAQSLLPIFEGESAYLNDNDRTAVALAVAQTLDKGHIGPELLISHDLEPRRLAQHLIISMPNVTKDFNESEKALYNRIILEASQYIVDVARQLPAFTERTFAEILTRERQLIIAVEQLLEEVRHIRERSEQVSLQASRFETEYRRAVVRNLDNVELFGIDTSAASRGHRLSVAYISLLVKQKTPNSDQELLLSVDEAVENNRCLLLRGAPGSGKTTLLKWIAISAALPNFESSLLVQPSDSQLLPWRETVPFFIRLRQCVESGLPTLKDLPRLVAPVISDIMPRTWVHQQLDTGRAIVLVDGIDEVPMLKREEVRLWLTDLVISYPQSRFIVTSRPYATEEGWMEGEGFSDAEFQPMELGQIYAFINHWHAAVQEVLRAQGEDDDINDLTRNLREVVRRNRAIRNLATNPLLCAVLCALHRDRQQHLPSDRIELYDASCRMLLERRDIERRVPLADYPNLSYRQKLVLLRDLAYYLLSNGWATVPLPRAQERLEWKLSNMQSIAAQSIPSSEILRFFIERSGMIREPLMGQIDFTHLSFQEFLAAQAALDEGNTGV